MCGSVFALIDGNSFYASCERVFRPDLRARPVVVLSNNDGCVITRTAEAKVLGIKMGEPYFKIKPLVQRHGVVVFSSNYELYGDLSRRMMDTIALLVPQTEIYSIDECFADLTGMRDITSLGHLIRSRVLQWVGIPTCVGIAPTKTLAKYCNHLAKRHTVFKGVVNWLDWDESIRTRAFKSEPVGEVWGIGYRISASLNDMGIQTVWDFVRADAATLRKRFGVVVERTQRELQGIPCADLEVQIADKQQIVRSRSFGKPVCDIEGLRASLAFHIAEAASELRAQNSTANLIGVMLRTNPFKPEEPQYKGYLTACLPVGSSDTLKLNRVVQQTLTQIYKSGYAYKKCGVVLMGIESANTQMQLDWLNPPDSDERKSLMHTIDALNQRFGRHSIRTADQDAAGNNAGWRMKRERLSPCYTTQFAQLLQVG